MKIVFTLFIFLLFKPSLYSQIYLGYKLSEAWTSVHNNPDNSNIAENTVKGNFLLVWRIDKVASINMILFDHNDVAVKYYIEPDTELDVLGLIGLLNKKYTFISENHWRFNYNDKIVFVDLEPTGNKKWFIFHY